MKDFQLTKQNLALFVSEIQKELEQDAIILVSSKSPSTGKWSMARLWRSWMSTTAEFMAQNGVTMPLMMDSGGKPYGFRKFSSEDAHELFTKSHLGVDENGNRLSWSKSGNENGRAATKGERLHALRKHEAWATERGIFLLNPRDSEYQNLIDKENE